MKGMLVICLALLVSNSAFADEKVEPGRMLRNDDDETNFEDLREDRDLVVLYEEGLYLVFDKYAKLVCVDDRYANEEVRRRDLIGIPFCNKPDIRIPRRCWWSRDRDEGVLTWTLKCRQVRGRN